MAKLKLKIIIEETHEVEVPNDVHEKVLKDPDYLNEFFVADIYISTKSDFMDKEDIGGNYHIGLLEIDGKPNE